MKGHKQNNNKVPKAPYVTKALRAHINRPEELKAEILAEALEGKLTNAELAEKYKVPVTTVNGYLSGVMGVEDRREQFAGHAKALDNTEEQIAALERGESLVPAPAPAPLECKPLSWMLNQLIEDGATYASVSAAGNCPKGTLQDRVKAWVKQGGPAEVETWLGLRKLVTDKEESTRMLRMTKASMAVAGAKTLEYSADEVARMKQLWYEGKTHATIASILGRTEKSVGNKLYKMGLVRKGATVTNNGNDKQQTLQFQAPAPAAAPAPAQATPSPSPSPLSILAEHKAQLAAAMAELDAKIQAEEQSMAKRQLRPSIIDRLATYINAAKDGNYCVIDNVCAVEMLKKADHVWDKRKDRTSTAIWITADKPGVGEYTEADLQFRYNAGHMDGKEAAMAELASTVTPAPTEPMITVAEADKRIAEAREKAHPLYGMHPHTRQIFEDQVRAFINTHVKASAGAQADVLRFMLLAEDKDNLCHNHHSLRTCLTGKKNSLGFFSGYEGEAIRNTVKHLVDKGLAEFMPPDPDQNANAAPTEEENWLVSLTDKGREKAMFFLAHPLLMRTFAINIQTWLDKQLMKKGGRK